MGFSETFIRNSVGTALLTIALTLAGIMAFRMLPVSPLPQVDFPTIQVQAILPGASPETMASSVATPLERQFGRIAGVAEMTSASSLGNTQIVLQFDLDRNIDAAARDVQAAINAARSQLPSTLPQNPTYRKVNPADSPIMLIALTSQIKTRGEMYDAASSILAQKLSQLQGVGQVIVGGGALPAVRAELNPTQLENYGIGLEQVRTAMSAENINQPTGELANANETWGLATNDQMFKAAEYRPLIVTYKNGNAVRLGDVGQVIDSVEDLRNVGVVNGVPCVLLIIFRQPGANVIETVDRIKSALPQMKAVLPPSVKLVVVLDQTQTIRASVHEVEITMLISVALVILVVFLFLRNLRATMIPGLVVPISLVGTFGVMYLLGFSVDNLSLMALTISTGFVVDDAIVVVENISRHLEQGMAPFEAAIRGASEIGFTVMSISLSLTAVFIPILLMGGIVGRLFREFAVTLSAAILVSMAISLTTTPMMCAKLLKSHDRERHGRLYTASEGLFTAMLNGYSRSLAWALRHRGITLAIFFATLGLNLYLFKVVPKGFFPQQDNGRLMGALQADQSTSFQALSERLNKVVDIIKTDPAVQWVTGFAGSGSGGSSNSSNTARMFITLKPYSERELTADQVIARLRRKVHVAGAPVYTQASQDLRVGGHSTAAQYQYTLVSDDLEALNKWGPIMLAKLRMLPQIADVNTDQENNGLDAKLVVDRATAARLGISSNLLDNTLYDAFGQRQVSDLYTQLNQYHVIMEVAPRFWQNPDILKDIKVQASGGQMVPLSAFTHFVDTTTPLAVNHSGQFPSATISFNLRDKTPLGTAVEAINRVAQHIGLPSNVSGSFTGTAQAFESSLANEPILILFALLSVYIVLGILYESYIHPITILSTLPSAGIGALIALLICGIDFSIIALIGIILLIGIVKKNAILMVDFALERERQNHLPPEQAIYEACLLRFRPIMMTTMAAMLGGLPLALGTGTGSELRRPLGVAIVGGLVASQLLTLYTTPVIYLYLDTLSLKTRGVLRRLFALIHRPPALPAPSGGVVPRA